MKLIADSGSTKTDWCLTDCGRVVARRGTQGINPFQQERQAIERIIRDELLARQTETGSVTEVRFYGAGCREEMRPMMTEALRRLFPTATAVSVESDLLAAARALCGHEAGVACILGTGSNSCLYDGRRVVANIPPMGYVLGDEGSGAVLGINLINALFKNRLPKPLAATFTEETGLTLPTIINKVYREPLANRFLASLSLFIGRHIGEYDELRTLVVDNFRLFFRNNIARYRAQPAAAGQALTVNAIGGMASRYEAELRAAAAIEGFHVGTVKDSPMDGLVRYHG